MKKLINLLSLVMLLSVNVLTPISYATENLGETGIIPENGSGMSENGANGSSGTEGEGSYVGNTQNFYPTSGASVEPQNDDGDEKTPQNDGSDVQVPHNDNTPSFQTEGDGSEGSSEGESGNTQDYPTNEDSSFLSNLAQSIANLLNAPFMAPTAENQNGSGDSQGASCVGMDMANISHTVKNGIITLEWDAVDGDVVEISIFNPENEEYESLGSVNMSTKKFSYTAKWGGEHVFKLSNGCDIFQYKADASIEFGTIAFPWPKDPTKGIIMLDHNLGATELGTGWDVNKNGYYYQWGNNYGFPLADPSANISFTEQKVYVTQYGPSNPYYGSAFYRPQQNWAYDNGAFTSRNLRGGGNDSTQNNWGYDKSTMTVIGAEDRQGPCPDGYHVPSAGEWAQLIAFYIGLYNIEHGTDLKIVQENGFNKFEGEADVVTNFINELLMPNSRMYSETGVLDDRTWLYAALASSSPTDATNVGRMWSFSVREDVLNMRDNPRASAQAVRCFANEYEPEYMNVSFVSYGEEIDSQEVARGFFATKPSDPQKDGYMFAGWYENPDFSGERFSFRTKIQSDLTLYAKWLEYDIISIQDPNDPTRGITIMDRNLGASITGSNDSYPNDGKGSYGYVYQRGNNYGFPFVQGGYYTFGSSKQNVTGYGPINPYYRDVFVRYYDSVANERINNWTANHDESADTNLWGGGNDSEENNWGYDADSLSVIGAEDRQGPCPDGWHVPSAGERSRLLNLYVSQYNQQNGTDYQLITNDKLLNQFSGLDLNDGSDNVIQQFIDDLFIARYGTVGKDGNAWWQTSFVTSSPIKDNSGFSWRFAVRDRALTIVGAPRAHGQSVRCFSNEFIEPKWTISFMSDGVEIASQQVTKGLTGTQPANPDRKGYTFIGWYDNADFSGDVFDFENTPIKSDITLYAKWKKNPGWSGRGNSRILNDEGDATHGSADDMTQSLTGKYIIPEDKQAEKWDMHKWAYDNGLTIYKPGEDAKFDQPLTRQQTAKISSIFGTKFLNQKADASEKKIYECSQYSDLDKSKGEMRGYVIQSCLMKNMGYAYDGVNLIKKFRPYDKLTVAQASVILSRMAWGDKYVISPKKWYQGHMYAVYDHGLIDDISNPQREVTRGEAFMMMYRLSQLKN